MAGVMKVRSYSEAGQMFLDLAAGDVELPPAGDLEAAKALLLRYGIEMEGYEEIVFLADSDTRKHLVVPAATVVENALNRIETTRQYHPMSPEQEEMYIRRFAPGLPEARRPGLKQFFTFRVGDYSTNHCA